MKTLIISVVALFAISCSTTILNVEQTEVINGKFSECEIDSSDGLLRYVFYVDDNVIKSTAYVAFNSKFDPAYFDIDEIPGTSVDRYTGKIVIRDNDDRLKNMLYRLVLE